MAKVNKSGSGGKKQNQNRALARSSSTEGEGISREEEMAIVAAAQEQGFDAIAEAESTGKVSESGVVENKDDLVGVPFIVLSAKVRDGDHGPYMSAIIMLRDNSTLILNDGSTGIQTQLGAYLEAGMAFPMLVKGGLRRSDYTYEDEDGNKKPASTYYLSNRPSRDEVQTRIAAARANGAMPSAAAKGRGPASRHA